MRDRRFRGDGRGGPPRLPGRTKDRVYSPRRRSRDRDYSSPRRARDGNYSPRRRVGDKGYSSPQSRIRDSPPRRTREHKYSLQPRRYHHDSSPLRTRNKEISPPPERTRNWEQHSLHGRSKEIQLSSSDVQPRGEYFHELERSRRMEIVSRDYGELKPLSYVGGDRDYAPSQIPDRGRGSAGMFAEHSHKEGSVNKDSTSLKYPWSNFLEESRKFDTVKGSSNYGVSVGRVSSEREYHVRPYSGSVDGAISLEPDKRILYSSYDSHLSEVGVQPRFSGVGDSSRHSMPPRRVDSDLLKDEEIHLQDGLHSHKAAGGRPVSRDLGMDDSLKSMRYSEFNSDYMISSSHSDMLPLAPGVFKDDIASSYAKEVPIRSRGGRLNSGKTIESIDHDIYEKNPGTISSLNPEKQVSGSRDNSGSYLGRVEEKRKTFMYSDIERGEIVSPNTLSGEFYGKRVSSGEARFQDVGRTHAGLSRFDEFSHLETKMEDRSRGSLLSSQKQSMPDYFESRRVLDRKRPDVDILDHGAKRLRYEHESHRGYESSRKRDLPEFQIDDDLLERSDALYREQGTYPREGFISRDLPGPSHLSHREKHGRSNNHAAGITISSDVRSAHRILDARDADEMRITRDTGSVAMSRRLNLHRTKFGMNGRVNKATATNSKFGGRDIKKRLGPGYQNLGIEYPQGKGYRPSLKKRLGPRISKYHPSPPWVKKFNSHKFSRNQDVPHESVAEQGDDPNEGNITPANTEPPENSKDFKKLVQNAFVSFVRHLNETPAKRRKYIVQAGGLKCLVCGRGSEDFADTESLALHALESPKAGLRSQHLGLHKALCALMGWKSAADAPNDGWVREMLSSDTTVALKEDLIIWPPVVIIHNSSIMSSNPDQRVVVSTDELESNLRDMGFGGKAKVSRGKPANNSVLMVKFSATLSGLHEAERLCDIYADRKHGRAEFQYLSSGNSGSNDGETKEASTDKVGNILYGYLGIAEDLDKLDFETKKRSAVRSKKQIKDIVVAP